MHVTISGVAGLSGSGLYQFNVEAPDLAEIGRVQSPSGVFLTTKR